MRRGRRNPSLLLIEEGESVAPFLFSFRSEQLSPPSSSYSLFLLRRRRRRRRSLPREKGGGEVDGRPTDRSTTTVPLGGGKVRRNLTILIQDLQVLIILKHT